MAIETGKSLVLALGLMLGVTACDEPGEPSPAAQGSWRGGGDVDDGGRQTLNTHAWIPASARDLHEFRDNGDVFVNGYEYEASFTSLTHPDTLYGPLTSQVKGNLGGEASVRLHDDPNDPNDDRDFVVEVRGPQPGDAEEYLSGAELIGLKLSFDMKDPHGSAYELDLEVVDHMTAADGTVFYELDRVDPSTGSRAPLCEQSEGYGRFARITKGLHIEGDTGDIDVEAPSLLHIGCLASVPAKAMMLGYRVTTDADEYDRFVLATRIVRADYCADGHPYTYPGNLFRTEDNVDSPRSLADVTAGLDPDEGIEAMWDQNGVLCVDDPRAPNTTREDIVCPTKHFADGTIVHNWQPPSCAGFVDTAGPDDLRIYSVTAVEADSDSDTGSDSGSGSAA